MKGSSIAPDGYTYARFLAAKKTVDERAFNAHVWRQCLLHAAQAGNDGPLHVVEVGCGLGHTCIRFLEAMQHRSVVYTLVDTLEEHLEIALGTISRWAHTSGFSVERDSGLGITIRNEAVRVNIQASVNDVIESQPTDSADLLIAQAFLDLFDLDEILPALRAWMRPGGLAYFPINVDGVTHFEPELDADLDTQVERIYHASMDARNPLASHTGRRLPTAMQRHGMTLLAGGGSDWFVHGRPDGSYPEDEAYFLYHMLHYVEQELKRSGEISNDQLASWVSTRRQQVEDGSLTLLVHQLDVLGKRRK